MPVFSPNMLLISSVPSSRQVCDMVTSLDFFPLAFSKAATRELADRRSLIRIIFSTLFVANLHHPFL